MPKRLAKARKMGMMKKWAGADTTEAGEPDYAKMFLRVMHKLAGTRSMGPDSTGSKPEMKGIVSGE